MAPNGSDTATLLGGVALFKEGLEDLAAGLDDDALLAFLQEHQDMDVTLCLPGTSGLRGAQATHPKSFEEIRARLVKRYGQIAFNRLYVNDAHVLGLVRDARVLRLKLDEARDRHPPDEDEVAYRLLTDFRDSVASFGYPAVLGVYATTEDAEIVELETIWTQLFADPDRRATATEVAAVSMQVEADQATAAGRGVVGQRIAQRERVVGSNVDINLEALMEPLTGLPTEMEAVTFARVSGVASAVVKVGGRFYIYTLSEDWEYKDVWLTANWGDHRTEVVVRGNLDVWALITNDGYVLRAVGGRYFGGDLARRPEEYLAADLLVIDQHAEKLRGSFLGRRSRITPLFEKTVMDVVLLNLRRAELRMREERPRFQSDGQLHPEAGAALKIDSARLRVLKLGLALKLDRLGTRDPTRAERDAIENDLAEIGEMLQRDPTVAFMVRDDRAEAEADEDPDEEPPLPDEDDYVDLLAGMADGDAALAALEKLDERLGTPGVDGNIDKARKYMYEDPGSVLGFGQIVQQVTGRFSSEDQAEIELRMLGYNLASLAKQMALPVVDALLFVVGLVTGGAGVLTAAGLVLGAVQTKQGFEEAERLAALSALDLPDGFELASEGAARSARRWAWAGVGLMLFEISLLGRQARLASRVRTLLRTDSELAAALARGDKSFAQLAKDMQMSERALAKALETAIGEERKLLFEQIRYHTLARRQIVVVDASALVKQGARQQAPTVKPPGEAPPVTPPPTAPPLPKPPMTGPAQRLRILIIGAERADEFAEASRLAARGHDVLVVNPVRNPAMEPLIADLQAQGGRFLQQRVQDLPAGELFDLIREDYPFPLGPQFQANEAFLSSRLERLRPGGRWHIVTEAEEFAQTLVSLGPRRGIGRPHLTEFPPFHEGAPMSEWTRELTRFSIIFRRNNPRIVKLANMARPAGMTEAIVNNLLGNLRQKLGRLWDRLAPVRLTGAPGGQIIEPLFNILKGNVAEILSDAIQEEILTTIRQTYPDAQLFRGARVRIRLPDGTFTDPLLFSDGIIGRVRNGNLEVLGIFEVKAGARGGAEAQSQIFEWIENRITDNSEVVLSDGRSFRYDPQGPGQGRVIDLVAGDRYLITTKGAERFGLRSGDQVAADVIRRVMPYSTAEVNYLTRRLLEAATPVP